MYLQIMIEYWYLKLLIVIGNQFGKSIFRFPKNCENANAKMHQLHLKELSMDRNHVIYQIYKQIILLHIFGEVS